MLVSGEEKQHIESRAAAIGASVSDFIRAAAEHYDEPSEAERALLLDLVGQIQETNARIEAASARLEAADREAASFDEDAYRAKVAKELLARDDIDWQALAALTAPRK